MRRERWRSKPYRERRQRSRPHDMFETTDYDFPDDFDVEDWMLGNTGEVNE